MDWRFKGIVKSFTEKTSKSGKPFTELVIASTGGKYEAICVCTLWAALDRNIDEGSEVEAEGFMNGREYNGKYYAGLTAKTVKATAAAPAAKPQASSRQAPAPDDSNLPF